MHYPASGLAQYHLKQNASIAPVLHGNSPHLRMSYHMAAAAHYPDPSLGSYLSEQQPYTGVGHTPAISNSLNLSGAHGITNGNRIVSGHLPRQPIAIGSLDEDLSSQFQHLDIPSDHLSGLFRELRY